VVILLELRDREENPEKLAGLAVARMVGKKGVKPPVSSLKKARSYPVRPDAVA
jgi:hypothetical protein